MEREGTHNRRRKDHAPRDNLSSSESDLNEPTPTGHVADDEFLYDAECAGVSGVSEYRRSKTRPPRAHEVQVEKNLIEWAI